MKRLRITIRALMIVVLACALALMAEAMRRRSSAQLALADACWRKACLDSDRASWVAQVLRRDEAPEVARLQRRADRWGALMEEHRRAARYPWLPVAPDPPAPE
jgi:hypothetical protein